MANDVIASRREARRRRILDNSENRLQKIIGRNEISDAVPLISQNGPYLQNIENGPIQSSSPNIQIRGGCNFQHAARSSDIVESRSYGEEATSLHSETENIDRKDNLNTQLEESPYKLNFYIIYDAKLHLVLLAILVKIILIFNYGFIFGESLMTPLCIIEVTDVLLININRQTTKLSSGIFGAILLLSGITQQKIAIFINCLQILTKIGQDTCVYIFTFVTFHGIMDWLENIENVS